MLISADEGMTLAASILETEISLARKPRNDDNKDYMNMVNILQHHKCITKKNRHWCQQFYYSCIDYNRFGKVSLETCLIRFLEPQLWERMKKSDAVGEHAFFHNAPINQHEHQSDVGLIGWVRWTEDVFKHTDEEALMKVAAT